METVNGTAKHLGCTGVATSFEQLVKFNVTFNLNSMNSSYGMNSKQRRPTHTHQAHIESVLGCWVLDVPTPQHQWLIWAVGVVYIPGIAYKLRRIRIGSGSYRMKIKQRRPLHTHQAHTESVSGCWVLDVSTPQHQWLIWAVGVCKSQQIASNSNWIGLVRIENQATQALTHPSSTH